MMEYVELVQDFLTPESVNEALRYSISTIAGFASAWIWRHLSSRFSREQSQGEICKSLLDILGECEKQNPLPEDKETSLTFPSLGVKVRVHGLAHSREGQLASVMIGEREAYPHLSKSEKLSIQVAYHDAVRRLREAKAKREQAAILHSLTSLEKKNK